MTVCYRVTTWYRYKDDSEGMLTSTHKRRAWAYTQQQCNRDWLKAKGREIEREEICEVILPEHEPPCDVIDRFEEVGE